MHPNVVIPIAIKRSKIDTWYRPGIPCPKIPVWGDDDEACILGCTICNESDDDEEDSEPIPILFGIKDTIKDNVPSNDINMTTTEDSFFDSIGG